MQGLGASRWCRWQGGQGACVEKGGQVNGMAAAVGAAHCWDALQGPTAQEQRKAQVPVSAHLEPCSDDWVLWLLLPEL